MKRIIICCDGTQNDPDQMDRDRIAPTNVVKISRSISEVDMTGSEEVRQIIYYDPGVGTGWVGKRIIEGMSGTGISENIIQAYGFLCENYEKGDEIFCFGFSRGAFTVRSLCGMINRVGLIRKDKVKQQKYYDLAYKLYRITRPGQKRDDYFESFKGRYMHDQEVKIKFLGVWDTVGSLGLPIFGNSTHEWNKHHDIFGFKETVEYSAHALAIDETRNQFRPRFLLDDMVGKKAEQKWFIGSHSNVGGGYVDSGLSDIALNWMIQEARKYGLQFNQEYIRTHVFPDPLGEIRNSRTGIYWLIGRYIRLVNGQRIPIKDLHESVLARFMEVTTDYNPSNTELNDQHNRHQTPNLKAMELTSPAEKKIEGLEKKYKDLRKKPRKSKGFFGKAADNLSFGLVGFIVLWFVFTLLWISSSYVFNISLKRWGELLLATLILILKLVVAPLLILIGLLLIIVFISFCYSKYWQFRLRRKHMK